MHSFTYKDHYSKGTQLCTLPAFKGALPLSKLLLEYGADPEIPDAKGLTPLQVAKPKIVDGGTHKGLKPRDRSRTRQEFANIQEVVDEAITKKAHGAVASGEL